MIEERATFWEHVEDLRQTLLRSLFVIAIGFVVSLTFSKPLIHYLCTPVLTKLHLFSPLDGMCATLKICFWTSLVTTSPFWLYSLLLFIAPALKEETRRLVVPFWLLSILFFSFGLSFAFYISIPFANHYLTLFNEGLGENLWGIANYLDYTLILMLSNGIAFESFVVALFLVYFGAVSSETLIETRRYAIVAIFILSAFLTPPDVVTQILLALPLMGLYELVILFARYLRT